MYRQGRPAHPFNDPDEPLYRRCKQQDVVAGHLTALSISFRNWSVNRGGPGFGEPEDVLFPNHFSQGIATFRVKNILPRMKLEAGPVFEFRAAHVPDEDNYAHSEIQTYKGGELAHKPEPPQLIKKRFRQMISDASEIIRQPQE